MFGAFWSFGAWHGIVLFGAVRILWPGVVCYGLLWWDLVWHGFYGKHWLDDVWQGEIRYGAASMEKHVGITWGKVRC